MKTQRNIPVDEAIARDLRPGDIFFRENQLFSVVVVKKKGNRYVAIRCGRREGFWLDVDEVALVYHRYSSLVGMAKTIDK